MIRPRSASIRRLLGLAIANALLVQTLGSPSVHAAPGSVAAASQPSPATTVPIAVVPTVAQLVGQKLVIRMDGTIPSASLLGRIRRGEVGGIVLFGFNITTKSALTTTISRLQAAAAAGGRPPLLIMVDQEGGTVRRIPWAGPTMSARQMGIDGRSEVATSQGATSAAALAELGINVNLAPVADVPDSTSVFMYQQQRTFAKSNTRTSRLANAFAAGTRSAGVVPVFKHFPGIGRAVLNTDRHKVVIRSSRTTLEEDLLPFRRAIAGGAEMLMLSNATYTAWDSANGAGWSKAVVAFLRNDLAFQGVTITDSLTGTSNPYGLHVSVMAARAYRAGTDMIMLTGSEPATQKTFDYLVGLVHAKSISPVTLRASWDRILALKATR